MDFTHYRTRRAKSFSSAMWGALIRLRRNITRSVMTTLIHCGNSIFTLAPQVAVAVIQGPQVVSFEELNRFLPGSSAAASGAVVGRRRPDGPR